MFLFPPFSLSPINPARGIWELVVTVLSETNGIVVVFFAVSDVFKRLWGVSIMWASPAWVYRRGGRWPPSPRGVDASASDQVGV